MFVANGTLKMTVSLLSSGLGHLSRDSGWIRAGPSGHRIQVGARFSAPVQAGSGVHSGFCAVGNGSLFRG
jgi:hypothetical protein